MSDNSGSILFAPVTAAGISFRDIHDTLGKVSAAADTKLLTMMHELETSTNDDGSEMSTGQITAMQQRMQDWTYTRELEAKANEKLGDLMKSIVSKS